MAVMQLIRRDPDQQGAALALVDAAERSPRAPRVSAGSGALLRLAGTCGEFGFRLRRVELASVSGREIDPDASLVFSIERLVESEVAEAAGVLEAYDDVYLVQVELQDLASNNAVYVNRYGVVDWRGRFPGHDDPAFQDVERRLVSAIQEALRLGSS